jgi:hypothetical protein
MVHLPVHASWLNQVEIYFSVVQRKALTPDDFRGVNDVADRLLGFQEHYNATARPFDWTFTRTDLSELLARIGRYETKTAAAPRHLNPRRTNGSTH